MNLRILEPNQPSPPGSWLVLGGFWVGLMLLVWVTGQAAFLPTPVEVLRAFGPLWNQDGLGQQLLVSFNTNLEALGIMVLLALGVAYATVMPLFRPLAVLISSGRYNGYVGLPLVFMSVFHNPHRVKLALLVFGVGVFTILSVVRMMAGIPKDLFDHSRTLRMGEWRVVWEVVVLGRFDDVVEILRVNMAMMWMMLPMVEGMFRFEGGVGSLMDMESHHFNMDKVFCTMFVILAVGLFQDYVIGLFKKLVCPYAELGVQKG